MNEVNPSGIPHARLTLSKSTKMETKWQILPKFDRVTNGVPLLYTQIHDFFAHKHVLSSNINSETVFKNSFYQFVSIDWLTNKNQPTEIMEFFCIQCQITALKWISSPLFLPSKVHSLRNCVKKNGEKIAMLRIWFSKIARE